MDQQRLRVLLVSPTLGGGGAEMHLLRLVNHLDRSAIEPMLALIRAGGSYERHLRHDVPIFYCPPTSESSTVSTLAAVPALRRIIAAVQPHAVMSFLENASIATYVALRRSRASAKLVLGIQNNFSATIASTPLVLRRAFAVVVRRTYARADHVVALSHGVAADLVSRVPAVATKLSVIYNAGTDEAVRRMAQVALPFHRPTAPLLVACGRLTEQKDFATLIKAIARISREPRPQLWIIGMGPEQERLESLTRNLGVHDRVRFLGFQDNPHRVIAAADLFVLSSRWEGFANVIVEALSCGVPVVSTDCPYGPAEILRGVPGCRLTPVGDASALAMSIVETLVASPCAAEREARIRRASQFHAAISAKRYAAVLQHIVAATSVSGMGALILD